MEETFIVETKHLLEYFKNNSDSFQDIKDFMLTLGALCGYACQAAAREEQKSYLLVKAAGKNYFFGDGLNYYLIESSNSFINIMKKKYVSIFKNSDFPDIVNILKNVSKNIGNKDYKINSFFNPEEKFPYYMKIWKNIIDLVKKSSNKPEGWPVALSLTLDFYMNFFLLCFGGKELFLLFPSIIENAIYISKMIEDDGITK